MDVQARQRHHDRRDLEQRPGRFSTSLCAGLSILSSFTAERPVRGIADVADDLGMGRSTIHRYATTLTALGYLEQGASRKYRLAPRGADIGLALLDSLALRHQARPHLRRLRTDTGHTVTLLVLVGAEVLCVDQLRGHRRGQYAVDLNRGLGARMPAHRAAAGRVLLAPPLEDAPAHEPPPAGPGRRMPGEAPVAVEDEQLGEGRRALATAVLDDDGAPLAAIEIAVPARTFSCEALLAAFAPPLRATAARIAVERALVLHVAE
jgi:IclR family pca regulon transcriptional regulator